MCDATKQTNYEVITAKRLKRSLSLIKEINDDDIVSLDAQIPNPDDGIKIAEAIRKSGCKCLIVWHSDLKISDTEQRRLGIKICSLPSKEWVSKIEVCNVEWEKQKNDYEYAERQSFSHLIALSLLCQGFLVAHGKKDNLPGWASVWQNLSGDLKDDDYQLKTKSITEGKDWWIPAFGNNYIGEDLKKVFNDSDKNCKKIQELINCIKDDENTYFKNEILITNNSQKEIFAYLVNEVYQNLTEILNGCRLNKKTVSS